VASGKVISQMTARHRAIEFRRFLDLVDKQVPAELAVHVICDNSSTHKTPAIQRWLTAHPRFRLHFTPTYSSWLNLVERWFAELTTKWLQCGTHRSVAELTGSIQSWVDDWNQARGRLYGPKPPTRSSTALTDNCNASATQDTSASAPIPAAVVTSSEVAAWPTPATSVTSTVCSVGSMARWRGRAQKVGSITLSQIRSEMPIGNGGEWSNGRSRTVEVSQRGILATGSPRLVLETPRCSAHCRQRSRRISPSPGQPAADAADVH
jgi:transposase